VIELRRVQAITPTVNQAGLDAIEVSTNDESYCFTGFSDHELAYATLQYQWRLAIDV
jgi:hypothetical protein